MITAAFVGSLLVLLGVAGWIAASLFRADTTDFEFGDDADFEEDDRRWTLTDAGWDETE